MNTKNLLLIGSAAWIAYILYSNMKRDEKIKMLQKQVADGEGKLKNALDSIAKSFTIPPQYVNNEDFSKDAAIFPAGINQQYNTCKGVTVAPPPVKVTTFR